MSYSAYVDGEYAGDIATTSGWSAFRNWVTVNAQDGDESLHLVTHGWSDDIQALTKNLGGTSDDLDVISIRDGIIALLGNAETILVSDGADGNGVSVRESNAGHDRKMPSSRKFMKALQRFFAKQSQSVIKQTAIMLESITGTTYHFDKSLFESKSSFMLADEWDAALGFEMRPYIELAYDGEVQDFTRRIGADPTFPMVVNPNIREAVDAATLRFAKSTNETTSMLLSDALDALRQELKDGLIAGDPIREMTKRVRSVFDEASQSRAMTIATTETSRAVHNAQVISGEASGVVRGWRWVLSEDACSQCLAVAESNPEIPLGGSFAKFGDHPDYSDVRFPPLHPSCACALEEILDNERAPKQGEALDLPGDLKD